ncbi:hypothetical protein LWI28_012723 [Acer negundo]|uniref:Uncharacterized protein n=1 Tax=Acer negundo TaxID=4023 RepID=A0AAD5IZR8_ACENE|nr:hypothetical protein LWI28_012723 [Acer negundo]
MAAIHFSTIQLVILHTSKWHRPDIILRQFGLNQGIPVHCDTEVKIHAVDRRGRHHYNWKAPEESISVAEPEESPKHYHDPYLDCARQSLADIQIMCTHVLQMIGETRHLEARQATTPAPRTTSTTSLSPSQDDDMEGPAQLIHDDVSPPPVLMPAKTRVPQVEDLEVENLANNKLQWNF